MKTARQKKPSAFKGAVLYTVLVVMLFMLILILTTIGLAGRASQKAYNQYYDTQTINSARSVVDSVIASMRDTSTNDSARNIGEDIVTRLKASKGSVSVDVTSDQLAAYGHIDSLVFTYVGIDKEGSVADKCYYITGSEDPIIKVQATVTMGGQTSTYSQYVIGDSENNSNTGDSPNGFVVLGQINGTQSTNPSVHSPAYMFVNTPFDYNNIAHYLNNSKMGPSIVNASAYANTGITYTLNGNTPGANNGVTIMGNFGMQNNSVSIDSNFTATATTARNDIPYLYVGGTFYNAGSPTGGSIGTTGKPVNVYCGRMISDAMGDGVNICGNIYCYNTNTDSREASPKQFNSDTAFADDENAAKEYAEKSWSYFGTNGTSKLIEWVSATAGVPAAGGSIYTKGSLSLDKTFNVAGNIYVGTHLYIGSDSNGDVKGNIFVDGSVDNAGNKLADKIYVKVGGSSKYKRWSDTTPPQPQIDEPIDVTDFKADSRDKVLNDIVTDPEDVISKFYDKVGEQWHLKGSRSISGLAIDAGHKFYSGNNAGDISQSSDGVTFAAMPKPDTSTDDGQIQIYDTSGVKSGKIPYTDAKIGCDNILKIKESCTLVGKFDKVLIYIEPTAKEIWINLYDVQLSDNCSVIVDDDDGKKSVNFYLPLDDDYSGSQDSSYAVTKNVNADYNYQMSKKLDQFTIDGTTYKNGLDLATTKFFTSLRYFSKFYNGEELDIKSNPSGSDSWQSTGIRIYSKDLPLDSTLKATALDEKKHAFINFTDSAVFFTGDIVAPSAIFKQKGQGGAVFSSVKYDSNAADSNKVACIGSVVVGGIKQIENDYQMFFSNQGGGGSHGSAGGGTYKWDPLTGYSDF